MYIESSLLYTRENGTKDFVHDTYRDFFLAKWFAEQFKTQGKSVREFLDDAKLSEKHVSMISFYCGLSKDITLAEPFMKLSEKHLQKNNFNLSSDLQMLAAESIVESGQCNLHDEALVFLVDELLDMTDEIEENKKAVSLVVSLSKRYSFVVDGIIRILKRNQAEYFTGSFDIHPYNPNVLGVLSKIGKGHLKIIVFLKDTVKKNHNVRSGAIKALCLIDDERAERILVDVIRGKYFTLESHYIDIIKEIKGCEFVKKAKYGTI